MRAWFSDSKFLSFDVHDVAYSFNWALGHEHMTKGSIVQVELYK